MKKVLFLLLMITACGPKRLDVVASGEVIVKHQVDLSEFEQYYIEYCKTIYTHQNEVDSCVTERMAVLVDNLVNQGLL